MFQSSRIVLASQSPFRAAIMRSAGLEVETRSADIDERAIEAPLLEAGFSPEDIALVLAEAKAESVAAHEDPLSGDALIVGCDQTLSLEGELLHKPGDMDQARRTLLRLSGRSHTLNSGIVLHRSGEVIWRHVSQAHMKVRPLSPPFIGHYLAALGEAALSSVGSYQIEGLGAQLFDSVDGDYFTVVGLPLLPLLAELRRLGVTES